MNSEPLKPVPMETVLKRRFSDFRHSFQHARRKSVTEDSDDIEGQVEMQEVQSSTAANSGLDLNHYHIVDEVWHYNSVDWGDKCKGLMVLGTRPSLYTNASQIFASAITPYTTSKQERVRRQLVIRGNETYLMASGYGHG